MRKWILLVFAFLFFISSCQGLSSNANTLSSYPTDSFLLTSTQYTVASMQISKTADTDKRSTFTSSFTAAGNTVTASKTENPSPVQLAMVGDIMLGRSLAERIQNGEGSKIFSSVGDVLQAADLAIGNLECAMGEGGRPASKAYTFLAPPQAASVLRDAGFDILSLANNHAMDFGEDVFLQSLNLLKNSEIQYVGAGINSEEALSSRIRVIGGVRFAFLAYASVPVEYSGFDTRDWEAGPSTPGIAWADDVILHEMIRKNRANADFIVVLFHFGKEGMNIPSDEQIRFARMAIDEGADLVVGSHPHLLQTVETYKNRMIFYSLGNFVFDEFSGEYNKSAILLVTIEGNMSISYSFVRVNIIDGIPIIGE